jgi:hypothetical protein
MNNFYQEVPMKNKVIIGIVFILLFFLGYFFINSYILKGNQKTTFEPKVINNMDCIIRGIDNDKISAQEMVKKNLGNNRYASGGIGKNLTIKFDSNTKFTLRTTNDMGKTYKDTVSDNTELKTERVITISGENKETYILAKKITILNLTK